MKQQTETYSKNLESIMRQKIAMEKKANNEKIQRMRIEEELSMLRNKSDVDMKAMRNKIEEELRTQFKLQQNNMWAKFNSESLILTSQFAEIKSLSMKKDFLIVRLS